MKNNLLIIALLFTSVSCLQANEPKEQKELTAQKLASIVKENSPLYLIPVMFFYQKIDKKNNQQINELKVLLATLINHACVVHKIDCDDTTIIQATKILAQQAEKDSEVVKSELHSLEHTLKTAEVIKTMYRIMPELQKENLFGDDKKQSKKTKVK